MKPFPGFRPRADLVEQVASPPYDVLNSEEARQMAADNPHCFLRVVKAEIDLPPDVDVHSDEVYQRSAENYRRMIEDGVLQQDPGPRYYIYQLKMGDHVQRGLVAGASVDEYERGLVKKHEHTRPDKENDRARHVEILRANAGPVLCTYRASAEVDALVDGLCSATDPVYDFVAADGIGHTLWVVAQDEPLAALRAAFARVPALYIADGHHRSASAFRVRDILRDKNPDHRGDEAYNHFLVVAFPDDQLRIMAYNRVVRDLNGLSAAEFLKRAAEKFEVAPAERALPHGPQQFGCYLEGKWHRLTARPGSFPAEDPVRSLDASILQENLLAPVLGIGDPRTDQRIDFVGGIRGTDELERRCAADMQVAFALHPVSVEQLITIADAGAIMPPKSTWFEPKLRSGIVVRSLDD